jgi:hypothetical protein
LPAEAVDHVEDAEHFPAIADHLPVTRLAPPEDPVPVDHERGAVGDVAILVEDAVRPDGRAVDVAQQREREAPGPREGVVAERGVAADRQEDGLPLRQLTGDLTQAGQLGRSDIAPVVAVEAEDDVRLAPVLREGDGAAQRGRKRQVGSGLTEAERDHRPRLVRAEAEVKRRLTSSSRRG